jgi:hypothetical protein
MGFGVKWPRRMCVSISLASSTLPLCAAGLLSPVQADSRAPDPPTSAALASKIANLQRMQRLFPDTGNSTQLARRLSRNCR